VAGCAARPGRGDGGERVEFRAAIQLLRLPTRELLVAAVDAAASRCQDDDQGIWEIRGPARPYLHGKLTCWVALDRGLAMADQLGAAGSVARWSAARGQIRQAITDHGWNPDVGAPSRGRSAAESWTYRRCSWPWSGSCLA